MISHLIAYVSPVLLEKGLLKVKMYSETRKCSNRIKEIKRKLNKRKN